MASADFSQLYRVLALRPGCSLEQFKQAYRRLVAYQHPDRAPTPAAGGGASPELSDVIALYDQAMRFYRTHGRLPGAGSGLVEPAYTPPAVIVPESDDHEFDDHAQEPETRETTPSLSRRFAPLAMLALLALAWATWQKTSEPESLPAMPPRHAAGVATESAASPGGLVLGMDMEAVRSIQGDPVQIRDDKWEYGPSWLRFENGKLVDWYSSPLYRLRTPTSVPPMSTGIPAKSS